VDELAGATPDSRLRPDGGLVGVKGAVEGAIVGGAVWSWSRPAVPGTVRRLEFGKEEHFEIGIWAGGREAVQN
jgi:hypothetical protein